MGYYKKNDFLHEKTDIALHQNMFTACHEYKLELERKKSLVTKKKILLQIEPTKSLVTKRKAKEIFEKAAKRARLAYQQVVDRKTSEFLGLIVYI